MNGVFDSYTASPISCTEVNRIVGIRSESRCKWEITRQSLLEGMNKSNRDKHADEVS